MTLRLEWWVGAAALFLLGGLAGPLERTVDLVSEEALEAHLARDLDNASALYDETLVLDPPRPVSAAELATIRRLAPRVFTTVSEPFGLRDVAAIVHPSSGTIAYHLFWEDDIDFPDDNDPSDHEVVWVRPSRDGSSVEQVWTYFHGRILNERGRREALDPRPRIKVQWGKHGSLPEGWRDQKVGPKLTELPDGIPLSLDPIPLERYLEGSFRKLSTIGRRLPEHPVAARLGWPLRFGGTLQEFLAFTREVDVLPMLTARSAFVSRLGNATLNRLVLPYNFRPKTEWPD